MTPRILIGAFLVAGATAQPRTFDVASVKPDKAVAMEVKGSPRDSVSTTPLSLTMRGITLRACIGWAYSVRDFQLQGPAWLGAERYDIAARVETPASDGQMRLMLRDLLASRFRMNLHRAIRDLPVFEMVATPNMPKLAAGDSAAAGAMRVGDGELLFQNYSMAAFADRLGAMPFRLDRPVVDKTGIEGVFNFRLKLAADATEMKHNFEAGDQGPSMLDEIRKQLGLRLESRRAPVETLIVESAEKVPSEN